jgi:hypothetical protein
MADQGLLGQSKPAGTTNTLLYGAPIDSSASAVLTIANDGTGAAYDVAIKNYDQELTVDASSYLLHEGDVITGYRFTLGTPIDSDSTLVPSNTITSADGEKTAKFESFYVPSFTEVDVKNVAIRAITVESVSGTFAVGDTLTKGSSPNNTDALVYAVVTGESNTIIHIGPSTLNGTGTEFADGDSVGTSGGASATASTGGVGAANNEFVFSTDGSTYNLFLGVDLTIFKDRSYRFDTSDSSMSGSDLSFSTTINGEWGPDNTAGTEDDGSEYTTGKTTNGTAGSSGAYIQFDFAADPNLGTTLYFYDGGVGTASNANFGGSDRFLSLSTDFTYNEIYVYELAGTWVNASDSFTAGGTSFTVTAQTAGPYGYVRSYSSTTLKVIKGTGSADFAGTDVFQDSPKDGNASRSAVTVSSVDVATTAVGVENFISKDKALSANGIDRITSLVIGPGERLIVESATQNNGFTLLGFEDASNAFTVRNFLESTAGAG